MDEQQLRQMLADDLPRLIAYYQEMSAEQGPGVLVVNYYPSGEIAQMEAKFLKSSRIAKLARQMGLISLPVQFERHNPQNQIVVAVVTVETKGVVTVEVQPPEPQTPEPEMPKLDSQASGEPKAKGKSAAKATAKRKSPAKTTTRRKTTSKSAIGRKKPSEE